MPSGIAISKVVRVSARKLEGAFDDAVNTLEFDPLSVGADEDAAALVGIVVQEAHCSVGTDLPVTNNAVFTRSVPRTRDAVTSVVLVDVALAMRVVDRGIRDDSSRR